MGLVEGINSENENSEQPVTEGDIFKNLSKYAIDAFSSYRTLYGQELLLLLKQQPLEAILNHIHDIVSSLLMVSEDETPVVRLNLVEQIPECFLQCHEHACPDLEYYLYDRLLQVLLQYLGDEEIEVRREAFAALTTLLEKYLIDKKRIEEQVCPAILDLSRKVIDNQNELQLRAVSLMGRTAVIIGPEKTKEIFLKPFIQLCSYNQNCVRRACTVLFPIFAQVIGAKTTEEELLPVFFKLCEDDFWGVRKACADSIPLIALVCSLECRRERITPVVMKLVDDSNKWVVCSILKVLGQLIPTFADPCIVGLTYLSNGELRITNPVHPDFRDHPDPEILANYEHLMNTFVEVSTPTGKKSFDKDKDQHEHRSCEEIAQIIADTKQKLYVQMTEGERVTLNNVMNLKTLIDSPGESLFSSVVDGKSKQPAVEFYSLFFNMPSAFGADDNTNQILNSSFLNSSEDKNHENNCPEKKFNEALQDSANSKMNDYEENNVDSENFSLRKGSALNRTKAPFRPREHFRRKNTPADLSSIIKQAIYEGQERSKHIPPPLSIPSNAKCDLKIPVPTQPKINEIPLETPSIENSPKSLDFTNSAHTAAAAIPSSDDGSKKTFVSDLILNPKELCDIGPVSLNSANSVISLPPGNSYSENVAKEQNEISQICINTVGEESKINFASNADASAHVNNSNITNDDDEDDAFNEFNSHKYWYISPEMPLDIDLVSSYESTSTKNENDDTFDVKSEGNLLNTSKKFTPPTDFNQSVVPVGILESFVKMCVLGDEPEMNLNCAYYFPAVALTIGRDNWHIIKSLLSYLCDDLDYKVRKTIASAIDVLAMILGKELATQDLIPIYLGFFKDLEEVKIEAIRNFANFLNVIDPDRHEEILSSVGFCLRVDSIRHWRVKEDMAKQVVILIQMYESLEKHDCLLYLTSLTGILLEDPVSCVREIAAEAMASIIRISSKKQKEAIVRYFLVKDFSLSSSWRKRQTFVNVFYILSKLNQLNENLLKLVIPEIARLSVDAVPNIRILVAKFLAQLVKMRPQIWESDKPDDNELIKIIERLRKDEDRDVKDILDEN